MQNIVCTAADLASDVPDSVMKQRAKIKRKLSLHDKNGAASFPIPPFLPPPILIPIANLDENYDPDDIDEETTGHLHREIEKAEAEGHTQGKPGSFLNKLIMHGNSKTEKEMMAGQGQTLTKENAKP